MPANQASNVDWNAIKAEWQSGKSFRELAREWPVSHVAISKRAKRENWGGNYQPDISRLAVTQAETSRAIKSQLAHGKRTPENAEAILCMIRDQGVSPTFAAARCGVSSTTIGDWRKDDPELDEQIKLARAAYLATRERNISDAGDRGDLRANLAILERAPESKEIWAGEKSQSGGITVILNMPDPKQIEPPTITVSKDE